MNIRQNPKPSPFVFLFFLAEGLVMGFFQNLGNVDKLWNYTFAENMASGLVPYRDFNLLQTPFSPLVNSLFLRLFGHHMLVIELLGGVLFAAICWQLYRIFLVLTKERSKKRLCSESFPMERDSEDADFVGINFAETDSEEADFVGIDSTETDSEEADFVGIASAETDSAEAAPAQAPWEDDTAKKKSSGDLIRNAAALLLPQCFLMLFTWNTFFEYSCLIVFLQLTLMRSDLQALLKDSDKGMWNRAFGQILLGVTAGLAMMSKQTYGFFVAAAAFLAVPIVCRIRNKTGRETGKLLFFRFLGILIPNLIFLAHLLVTGTFGDFWDMCIAGVSTFETRFSYIYMAKENWGNTLLAIGAPLWILVSFAAALKWRKEGKGQAIFLILLYGAFGLINLYPMANFYHFATCLMAFLPLIPALLPARVFRHPVPDFAIQAFVIATALYCLGYVPIDCMRYADLKWDIPQFEGVFIQPEQEEDIRTITAYVKEKKEEGKTVYILDNKAGQYFLPLDDYHKYFDMFLLGNLGTTPPLTLLQEYTEPGAVFLIPGKDRTEWQYPFSAVREFQKGLKKGKEIGEFTEYFSEDTAN